MADPYEQAYNDDEFWAAERMLGDADESWCADEDEDEPEPDPDKMLEDYHWNLSSLY